MFPVSSNQILLNWTPLTSMAHWNGEPIGYVILYRSARSRSVKLAEKRRQQVPSGEEAEKEDLGIWVSAFDTFVEYFDGKRQLLFSVCRKRSKYPTPKPTSIH
jgi:hypothetical protein